MNMQERMKEKAKYLLSNISSDDGTLKYDFMTSLQNIAKAKIMTTLYMNQILQQTKRDSEKDLIPIISKLPLPDSIIKELIPLISHVRRSIIGWIIYYEQFLLNAKEGSEFHAEDFISNITWTARGKIDHVQTAKNILLNRNNCLSDDQKYKIACNFCLEEEIAIFGAKLITETYLVSIDIKRDPMIYFWTMHITGDNSLFDHYRSLSHKYSSVNEHVMKLLIYLENHLRSRAKGCVEVPLRYIWNKLSEKEKAKNFVSIISGESSLTYSLFSELNYEQQHEVFKRNSLKILQNIINDWSWEHYFLPTALHVLSIIDPKDFYGILYLVVRKAKEHFSKDCNLLCNKYKDIFKQLYKESSRNLRARFIKKSESFLTCELSWERDLDMIDLIFEDLDSHRKKNIILGSNGIICCKKFILSNQWDLLELFIKYTLTSEEDINLLKQRLKENLGLDIAVNFLEQKALNKIDYFINWLFKSGEDIDQFKRSLAHVNYKAISIFKENEVDFTDLENHFKWCAKEEPQAINQFKAEAPRYLIGTLLESRQFVLVDQILNWCLETQEQIARFKSNMYKDYRLSFEISLLISSLLKKHCPFTLLDRFVSWSFTDEQEKQEFKMWLLYPQKEKPSVCAYLLKLYKFDLADKFIEWSGITLEAVREFKYTLMLSDKDMRYILYPRRRFNYSNKFYPEHTLPLLIEWFNPSLEIVQKCRALFVRKRPSIIYKLYNELIDYESKNFS